MILVKEGKGYKYKVLFKMQQLHNPQFCSSSAKLWMIVTLLLLVVAGTA
jgi:hypothetical protein